MLGTVTQIAGQHITGKILYKLREALTGFLPEDELVSAFMRLEFCSDFRAGFLDPLPKPSR